MFADVAAVDAFSRQRTSVGTAGWSPVQVRLMPPSTRMTWPVVYVPRIEYR